MDKPDVVIIGAGIGGLITGAILAKIDGMKVLILEKESTIGGRIISFGGPHGDYSADEYRRLLRGAAWSWVAKSEPKLSEIIDKGLFNIIGGNNNIIGQFIFFHLFPFAKVSQFFIKRHSVFFIFFFQYTVMIFYMSAAGFQ